ncbi:hypothetical protein [Bacillus wiedmannii]|uniref:hypothetical protein n=1 Tax=Bacillus cereus group TaxID=86661 RepID=UPI002E1BA15F|nr:hypothetical protein [Bacillus wiedmannii]
MLIVVTALLVTALAACGNNRNPEEVATVTVDAAYKGNPKKVIVIELEKTDDG